MKLMGCEVIERPILKGVNIAIKQGDKLYVWPDFVMPNELKFIEIPTPEEWEKELMKPRFDFYEEGEHRFSGSEQAPSRYFGKGLLLAQPVR